MSRESSSAKEIEDELEWLINEFRNHIKYHKMKINYQTFETILKLPFETIENIVKFKFSNLIKPFLIIKKRKI